jgi:cytochrome c oxidase assembly protein subunit 15
MAAISCRTFRARDRDLHNRRCCAAGPVVVLVLFALVLVGGATKHQIRLSITEWQPIHGVSRRSTTPSGRRVQRYQRIRNMPLNKGMSIEAFKTIFWWMGAPHPGAQRRRGLCTTAVFLGDAPSSGLGPKLAASLLGGLQGAIAGGWWPGLVDRARQPVPAYPPDACSLIFTTTVVARLAPHSGPPLIARRGWPSICCWR